MVIKIRDPRRWMTLPVGDVILLEGTGRRPIRLEINAEHDASFRVAYPDNTDYFLGAFRGMEIIEFVADGPCEIYCTSEGEVAFYTDDGRNIAFINDGKVLFAKPHERRGQSDQIIYMQGLMLENERRRNAQLEAFRASIEAKQAEESNGAQDDTLGPDTGELSPGSGEPPVQSPPDAGANGVAKSEQPAS